MRLWIYGAAALLSLNATVSNVYAADTPARKPPSWQEMSKWPDLTTGMWQEQMQLSADGRFAPMVRPQLTPQAQAILAAKPRQSGQQGGGTCNPPGMPGMVTQGYSIGFYYAQNAIFMMTDMDNLWMRRLFTDRTEHGDPDPSWMGHSIAHWEKDTLVVDTVALFPEEELSGVPSNGATHIVERFRLTDPDTLEYKISIANPEVFVSPWEMTKSYRRRKDWEIQDAWCGENNRSSVDEQGVSHLDLTPPQ